MNFIFSTLKKILFWSYERGTWQYDLMCVVILIFVFAMPNKWLDSHGSSALRPLPSQVFITRDELGAVDSRRLPEEVSHWLSEKYGRQMTVTRVSPQYDSGGNLNGYAVYDFDVVAE